MSRGAGVERGGSRKTQILQALAHMLETRPGEVITTAALAEEVGVSEAALYRHFPSKFKMFEALIEFIEETIFSRVTRILEEEQPASAYCGSILWLVLSFAEKNPGLARLLYGDALVGERDKLRLRVSQFYDRLGTQLRQLLREGELKGEPRMVAAASHVAGLLVVLLDGKISQYARSNFRELPTRHWKEQWQAVQQGLFAEKPPAL